MSDLILDANVIRNIGQGNRAAAEALQRLLKSGRRVYISRAAYNEVIGTKFGEQYRALLNELRIEPSPASNAKGMIKARGAVYADNMAQTPKPSKGIPGPMPEYGGIKDPVTKLKTRPGDAFVGAEAKALDAELWTLDQQFARQARQQGIKIAPESSIPSVAAVEDAAIARQLLAPPRAVPVPKISPMQARLLAAKVGFKAGLKAAFSAENIAAALPQMVLAVADKVAAREASRNIQSKFIKEGFAKGVAAGIMEWTEEELRSNLLNRVTNFRVKGMGDAAGLLTMTYILKLAEAYENYAVQVGYQFSNQKPAEWKASMRTIGFAALNAYGYHFSGGNDVLFEFEFIQKLAWALQRTTDAIVGPAIRFS